MGGTGLKPADEANITAPQTPPSIPAMVVPGIPVAESGMRTTEFFATQIAALVTQIIALVALFHGIPNVPPGADVLIYGISQTTVGLVEAGYAVSRGIRKQGTNA